MYYLNYFFLMICKLVLNKLLISQRKRTPNPCFNYFNKQLFTVKTRNFHFADIIITEIKNKIIKDKKTLKF